VCLQIGLLNFGLRVYIQLLNIDLKIYSMEIQDLTSTQDMEPNSIDLTFIIMKSKNLIQRGCRSGITSDGSNR
jgi:hypothetical protein